MSEQSILDIFEFFFSFFFKPKEFGKIDIQLGNVLVSLNLNCSLEKSFRQNFLPDFCNSIKAITLQSELLSSPLTPSLCHPLWKG